MTGTRVEIEHVTCNKEMKTNRVLAETFYEEMKKSVENVSPYRWDLLNRMADRSLRV